MLTIWVLTCRPAPQRVDAPLRTVWDVQRIAGFRGRPGSVQVGKSIFSQRWWTKNFLSPINSHTISPDLETQHRDTGDKEDAGQRPPGEHRVVSMLTVHRTISSSALGPEDASWRGDEASSRTPEGVRLSSEIPPWTLTSFLGTIMDSGSTRSLTAIRR